MKLKIVEKKIRRLVARIEKDTKKLARLRLKLSSTTKTKKPSSKKTTIAPHKPPPAKTETKRKARRKKKSGLTPAGRAKLADAMKARWAAKRAGAASSSGDSGPVANSGAV